MLLVDGINGPRRFRTLPSSSCNVYGLQQDQNLQADVSGFEDRSLFAASSRWVLW